MPTALLRHLCRPDKLPVILTVVVVLAFLAYRSLPALCSSTIYDNDASQHVYWAQQAWDADLLSHDDIARFYASDAMSPVGWRWIIQTLAFTGEIQLVSELAMVLLILATCLAVFAASHAISGTRMSGFVGATVWLFLEYRHENAFGTGLLQRHFAVLFLAGGLHGLASRRLWITGLAAVGAALVYPITLAVLGLTGIAFELRQLIAARRLPRGFFVALPIGLFALVPLAMRDVPEQYGDRLTVAESRILPNFQADGRQTYWSPDTLDMMLDSGRAGIGHGWADVLTGGLALVVLGLVTRTRPPLLPTLLAVVSLGTWLLAFLFPFVLYLPNRHAAVPLPLALGLVAGAMLPTIAATVQLRLPEPRRKLAAGGLCVVFAVVVIDMLVKAGERLEDALFDDDPGAAIVEHLRSMPPDTLIAGHLKDVDGLPLETGRAALITYETFSGWYPKHHVEVDLPRTHDVYRAYFATDWSDVDRLHDIYGVDAFYWTDRHVNPPKANGKRPPSRDEPLGTIEDHYRQPAATLVLADPPEDRVLARDERGVLVRVGEASD
ncbi:MAG: hypothetical protein AAGI46_01270 [Planctomycetota bacterium]